MKSLLLCFALTMSSFVFAQYNYDASEQLPFGKANPKAPEQIKDYQALIGLCECKSTTRKQDGTWNDPIDMIWRWKYIMNGMAIQDETLKADGTHSGSIRQFNTDSSKWYVHFFSSKGIPNTLPTWTGNKKDGKIILYKDQKAPNGTEGFFRLTFYDISKSGYKWIGEWVDKTETIVYPTWKIDCKRK
ncbi:hypothetical protein [Ichthyenterobacterium magnum]|uniref:Uncharacterized protein n=1 Tax=Ichthyenterobacterium magnum TaxID=1230530 RepID=A0A420DF16_9FLAO|nr:hypothetical protein [Ichthyenterobacterium magnum]RKE90894.1 hypothetical protein BXY80_2484 [Ichthyenterobacterium magnum]